jgi:RNA polymerase sigma factor (TIGR02999 family)
MKTDEQTEVTALLEEIRAGNDQARQQLLERIYAELHHAAEGLMGREPLDHTLQPTALLHEALARLCRADVFRRAPNRAYLFGAAARAMRQVLVEHARRRKSQKCGGGRQRLPLDAVLLYFEEHNLDVEALHEALEDLARLQERQSHVVTLRFFGGFTVREIAEQLDVSTFTVENDFRIARAWLRRRLREDADATPASTPRTLPPP